MLVWEKRSIELASLFNPAFCSLLLRQSIAGYQENNLIGMPFSLTFLILPIVLHRNTRQTLPRDVRKKMHAWLTEHNEAKIFFCERTQSFIPYTKEALIYGMKEGLIDINENGEFIVIPRTVNLPWKEKTEFYEFIKRARYVGRWLRDSGEPMTIYHMWGIRP